MQKEKVMLQINKYVVSIVFVIIALFSGMQAHGEDKQSPMRIMTYNIRREGKEKNQEHLWANRAASLIALLRNQNPDIIGLQEVTQGQRQTLEESLSDKFNMVGKSRGTSWFGLGTDEATPIAYQKDKFELVEEGTFPLNSGFVWMPWHASQTGYLPRICTWAKLKDTKNNKEFYVYNTHLDHMYEAARLNGAREIVHDINQRTAGLPVIVTGDFNTAYEGDMKKTFSDFKHVKDLAARSAGPQETSTGWDNKKLQWIDHILVNGSNAEVPTYRVIEAEGYPSDHRPVVADINIP